MNITIGTLYPEVNVSFDIPITIVKYLRDKINIKIIKSCRLDSIDIGKTLSLIISTKRDQIELDIKYGKTWNKNQEIWNIGIWIPYFNVTNAKISENEIVKYFCESLAVIFKNWNVDVDISESIYQEYLEDFRIKH